MAALIKTNLLFRGAGQALLLISFALTAIVTWAKCPGVDLLSDPIDQVTHKLVLSLEVCAIVVLAIAIGIILWKPMPKLEIPFLICGEILSFACGGLQIYEVARRHSDSCEVTYWTITSVFLFLSAIYFLADLILTNYRRIRYKRPLKIDYPDRSSYDSRSNRSSYTESQPHSPVSTISS